MKTESYEMIDILDGYIKILSEKELIMLLPIEVEKLKNLILAKEKTYRELIGFYKYASPELIEYEDKIFSDRYKSEIIDFVNNYGVKK